jgi:hypothetical protein
MSASDAQISANRRNSQLSTGPKTDEGKARSRRNALKHGLTGAGVALPDEDVAEIADRFQALQEEHQPSGVSSRLHLRRYAYLSVRLERCERLDTAIYSKRVRHAEVEFDDQRMTKVEELAARLLFDPMTTARRLQATPEGIDYLTRQWLELRADLSNRERAAWTQNHRSRMEQLMGHLQGSYKVTRNQALTEALSGFFYNINPSEGEGLSDLDRREWARDELTRNIDAEMARLATVRASLDPHSIDQDRLEAADRCLFDLQPAMNLVRKYEAATERAMYKALKEFQSLEATLKATDLGEQIQTGDDRDCRELASSDPQQELAETLAHTAPRTPPPSALIPETIHFTRTRSLEDAPKTINCHEKVV